jgi:hypothetical protein
VPHATIIPWYVVAVVENVDRYCDSYISGDVSRKKNLIILWITGAQKVLTRHQLAHTLPNREVLVCLREFY